MQSERIFNIGYVSQQTGVAAVTLRAWERRYGLIKPERTPKGHRCYKQANIDEIHLIIGWLNRGVSISKVAPLLASNKDFKQVPESHNHWLKTQQKILTELIKLRPRSLNQLIDLLNKSTPFISLCENVYQPFQLLLKERWQAKEHGYELELQLWQQCWQRQISLMTLRADKQKSNAHCMVVNLGSERPSLDYWLFHGLLLQAGLRIDAINNIKDIACLNRLNQTDGLPIILFADRRLNILEMKQLSKLITSWSCNSFCAGRVADIHSEHLTELEIKFKGGSASECWQSAKFQAWLVSIGQQ
ncbi:MAG: MerR family transcriptional regulator [Pseudomonadota bacterium]|nr:MerR family transcriptional regulator [Pseudomonadota bacterium]